MTFKIYEKGEEIVCNILFTFTDENNGINYIIYTDGTKDDENDLEIYASRYALKGVDYYLEDIETEFEWNLIDNMLESKYKELRKNDEIRNIFR